MDPVVFRGAKRPFLSIVDAADILLGELKALDAAKVVEAMLVLAEAYGHQEAGATSAGEFPKKTLPSGQLAPPQLADGQPIAALAAGARHLASTSDEWAKTKTRVAVTLALPTLAKLARLHNSSTGPYLEVAEAIGRDFSGIGTHPNLLADIAATFSIHAQALADRSAAAADEFELGMTREHAWYIPRRRPSWVQHTSGDGALLPNNPAFADRVLSIMLDHESRHPATKKRSEAFARTCDLNSLPKSMARRSALAVDSVIRIKGWAATAEDLCATLVLHVLGKGEKGEEAASNARHLVGTRGFEALAQDERLVKALFDKRESLSDAMPSHASFARDTPEISIARLLPEESKAVAMKFLRSQAIKRITWSDDTMRSVGQLLDVIVQSTMRSRADEQCLDLEQSLLSTDFQELLLTGDVDGKGFVTSERFQAFSEALGIRTTAAHAARMKALVVDSGIMNIGELARRHMTEEIIGPALRRNPGRLAEVTDFETFLSLATRFEIPVALPEGVKASSIPWFKFSSEPSAETSTGDAAVEAHSPAVRVRRKP